MRSGRMAYVDSTPDNNIVAPGIRLAADVARQLAGVAYDLPLTVLEQRPNGISR